MSQVFRRATERKNKTAWEMSWCLAIVLLDGFLDIATHAAARFPPHSPSTAIQALNGLNHISPPDLQWLIKVVFFRKRKNSKYPTGHDPCFPRTMPTQKAWNRRQQLPEA